MIYFLAVVMGISIVSSVGGSSRRVSDFYAPGPSSPNSVKVIYPLKINGKTTLSCEKSC